DSAFSAEEKTAIVAASISSNGIDCKNNSVSLRGPFDTQDQVFFLSPSDVYDGDRPVVYGFHAETTEDEGRIVLPTTYALAMGAATTRYWYLRSVGWFGSAWEGYPVLDAMGADGRKRTIKTGEVMGVRPALYLNSFALERYSYAGTVCSDGTVDEKNVPMVTPQPPANNGTDDKSTKDDNTNGQPGTQKQNPSFAYTKTYNKTLGDKPFALESRLKTGDGSLSYKSSDPKVASISSEGKVTIRGTGICTITISASETANYNGRSVKATIQVSPKKAVLKTLKPGKKQLKVTWKKDTGADGYQIQYSTDKKFKKKTAVAVGKNKTTSRTIKKLTKGKRYYVRMRSYKKAKLNGKSKTLYGAWSKVQFSKKIK
ncbi:MAG TPA: hypothetical protein DF613_17195, partial [Lachnospiraceae bacterium]|nr:hypothetical protein [Lachnospiraceae bacterium]